MPTVDCVALIGRWSQYAHLARQSFIMSQLFIASNN